MVGAMLALVLGGALATVIVCLRSPSIAFVTRGSRAQWITYPARINAAAQSADYNKPATVTFSKSFVAESHKRVALHYRAMRTARIYINGSCVPFDTPANWKVESEADITALIRPGENVLRAEVANPNGPQLLYLYADTIPSLTTDETWTANTKEQPDVSAIIADDCRGDKEAAAQSTTLQLAAQNWPLLAVAFVASCVAFCLRSRWPRWMRQNPGLVVMLAITAVWIYVFVANVLPIPSDVGFDSTGHLDYIQYILHQHTLPAPTESWCSYQPPLYYVLAALAYGAGSHFSGEAGGLATLKIVAFLFGLGNVWIAYLLARLLFGAQSLRTAVAALFAGILPMNIYISAYTSNESTHAFFAGLALLFTVYAIKEQKVRLRTYAAIGLAVGLAVLSKYTVLVVAPLLVAALALKLILIETFSRARVAKLLLVVVLLPVLVGGWYYVRNTMYTGNPLFGNWAYLENGHGWWQQPGFHTPHYYLSFGESLVRPYLCSFRSYWDALYSTFWSDGQIAGQIHWTYAQLVWDYDLMSVVSVLAVPATLMLGAGILLGVRSVLKGSDAALRTVWWLITMSVLVLGLAMLAGTLKLPYCGQAKAFYGLALMSPLVVFAATAFGTLDDLLKRHRWFTIGRMLLYGWLGTLAIAILVSFATS